MGRHLKYKTTAKLKKAIDAYFDECKELGDPLTVTGLGLKIGLTRKQLCDYAKREPFSDIIIEAKQKVEHYAEKNLFAGNPAGPIFALKNFGWKDKQEIDQNIKHDFSDLSDEELDAKIKDLIKKNE